MPSIPETFEWILAVVSSVSALGVILARKPVYACLCFLLALVSLAVLYLEMSAPFIATMQLLIYGGATMVIFMFIIVLFQDAHDQIARYKPESSTLLLVIAMFAITAGFLLLGYYSVPLGRTAVELSPEFGTVQSLGSRLYIDFVFPFEALVLPLLVAAVGTLYIAKKG